MTCQKPLNALLSCNINVPNNGRENLFPVIYTDLLLNQFNVKKDFDKLIRELGISSADKFNFLIICDEITNTVFQRKVPKNDRVFVVIGDALRRRYDGIVSQPGKTTKPKISKNPNRDAFRLDNIHSFPNKNARTVVLLINTYKTFFVERLIEDNDKSLIERIFVVLNSLVEFPFMYTLEKPFKIALFNDVSDESSVCNYRAVYSAPNLAAKRTGTIQERRDDYVSIDVGDIVNDIPANIRPDAVYVFDLSGARDMLKTKAVIYRLFKMFYYTYCFNGARWSIHPNNERVDSLYTFRRRFDEEMLIVSKWWPDDETVSFVRSKLQRWCPQIFGTVNEWFFHCDVRKIFAEALVSNALQLPYVKSRPLFPGGQIWQPATLAYMSLVRIGIGTTTVLHTDILDENCGKKDVCGYYKHLFDIEYDTRV